MHPGFVETCAGPLKPVRPIAGHVPNVPAGELRGCRVTRMARSRFVETFYGRQASKFSFPRSA
jgi:hypothetical protein